MDKGFLIKDIAELLLKGKRDDCITLLKSEYPFEEKKTSSRNYSKTEMCKVFLKDNFIDRYSGEKLIFPGMIKILSLEFPDIIKYHKNWKMSETHMIYWEMMPTVDHLIPVARGGKDEMSNWVTTSMIRNSAKSNWILDELGWELLDENVNEKWDGLYKNFLLLTEKNPDYEKDNYVKEWKNALIKVLSHSHINSLEE